MIKELESLGYAINKDKTLMYKFMTKIDTQCVEYDLTRNEFGMSSWSEEINQELRLLVDNGLLNKRLYDKINKGGK